MLMLTSKHPTAETFVQVSETEIANSSRTISALHAMMNVCGIDLDNSVATAEEISEYYGQGS